MFGDEQASAKEISLFLVWLLCQGSAVSKTTNETGHARANVVTPPPTLVNLVTIGSLATHQILAQLATRILRYGDGVHVRTCNDVPPTHDLWKALT